jgi:hypothetical protein
LVVLNEARLAGLMEPHSTDAATTFEETRSAWHAQAAFRGKGAGEWVNAPGAGDYTVQRAGPIGL